jgi:hypothetical protein
MARKRQTLTAEEKAENARQRKIEVAYGMSTKTYSTKFVAPVFQKMIRAEAGAQPSESVPAIVNGDFGYVFRLVGYCVCVTCGKVSPWTSHEGQMQTGHFLPGRLFSILFEEDNVAPQCVHCNKYRGGAIEDYRLWMEEVRGVDTIERLTRLKATTRQFTREELVDMRSVYEARLNVAENRML